MTPGLRQHGPATLHLSESKAIPGRIRSGILEITHMRCDPDHRGRGCASLLMQRVCNEADQARKVLMLHPQPYADSPLDEAALIEWYARFGFDLIQTQPEPLMARPACAPLRTKMAPIAAVVEG